MALGWNLRGPNVPMVPTCLQWTLTSEGQNQEYPYSLSLSRDLWEAYEALLEWWDAKGSKGFACYGREPDLVWTSYASPNLAWFSLAFYSTSTMGKRQEAYSLDPVRPLLISYLQHELWRGIKAIKAWVWWEDLRRTPKHNCGTCKRGLAVSVSDSAPPKVFALN